MVCSAFISGRTEYTIPGKVLVNNFQWGEKLIFVMKYPLILLRQHVILVSAITSRNYEQQVWYFHIIIPVFIVIIRTLIILRSTRVWT